MFRPSAHFLSGLFVSYNCGFKTALYICNVVASPLGNVWLANTFFQSVVPLFFQQWLKALVWSRGLELRREQGFSALCVHVGGELVNTSVQFFQNHFLKRLPSSCLCLYQKLNDCIRGDGLLGSVFPY